MNSNKSGGREFVARGRPVFNPWELSTMKVYVYNQISRKFAFAAASIGAAIAEMKNRVPTMEDARRQFVAYPKPRPDLFTGVEKHELPIEMPWGRYAGCRLSAVPWQYLDRCLSREVEVDNPDDLHGDQPHLLPLHKADPILYDAILLELAHRREWREHAEDNYRRDVNHIQNFDPSGARGR